jgi:hypothetical protein
VGRVHGRCDQKAAADGSHACAGPRFPLQEVKRQIEVLKKAQEQAFVEQQRVALEVGRDSESCAPLASMAPAF